jgi:hypothetical protein
MQKMQSCVLMQDAVLLFLYARARVQVSSLWIARSIERTLHQIFLLKTALTTWISEVSGLLQLGWRGRDGVRL